MNSSLDKISVTMVMMSFLVVGIIGYSHIAVQAYDVTPTVDPSNINTNNDGSKSKTLLTGAPNIYRFGQPTMKNVTYSDGSVVPSMTVSIEQYNQTSKQWEIIGATNTHLHKLKVDTTDKFDISLGHTDRFNPRTIPPVAPPTTVD
jgi:hypothetical protein